MAEDEIDIDLSTFVPEGYKGEDGTFDTAKFRADFDDLSAFKGQEDDRLAQLPTEAAGYAFSIAEDHALPEGFDPKTLATKDADGNDVEFDVASMIDADDPDIPLIQEALLEAKAPAGLMEKIAGIFVNREIRQTMNAATTRDDEKKALGPSADARIATVTRALEARMPKEQVKAVLDGVTSADSLRGLEQLLKGASKPVSKAPAQIDMTEMSPRERIAAGLEQRKRSA